jgi:hypothetical protein
MTAPADAGAVQARAKLPDPAELTLVIRLPFRSAT